MVSGGQQKNEKVQVSIRTLLAAQAHVAGKAIVAQQCERQPVQARQFNPLRSNLISSPLMNTEISPTKIPRPTDKSGAVLLAAGEGSRMGSVPKSLLVLDGKALIHRHLCALREAGLDEIIVVTGYHHEAIEAALVADGVRMVRNPNPQRGQQSSVRLGVSALGRGFDRVMVVLADQPLIDAADHDELMRAFTHRPAGAGVMYPQVGEQRGNPVLFSGEVVARMLDSGDDADFRRFIDAHPDVVYRYPTSNTHFIIDLDTPEDIAALAQRTGRSLQWPASLT